MDGQTEDGQKGDGRTEEGWTEDGQTEDAKTLHLEVVGAHPKMSPNIHESETDNKGD